MRPRSCFNPKRSPNGPSAEEAPPVREFGLSTVSSQPTWKTRHTARKPWRMFVMSDVQNATRMFSHPRSTGISRLIPMHGNATVSCFINLLLVSGQRSGNGERHPLSRLSIDSLIAILIAIKSMNFVFTGASQSNDSYGRVKLVLRIFSRIQH